MSGYHFTVPADLKVNGARISGNANYRNPKR